jgi:hypothetical protein
LDHDWLWERLPAAILDELQGGPFLHNRLWYKSILLVIEISAAIRDMPACKILEYWSDGVLECWVQKRKKI